MARVYVRGGKLECSKCGKDLEPELVGKQRYCRGCHNEASKLSQAKARTELRMYRLKQSA